MTPEQREELRRLHENLLAIMRRMDCQDLFDDALYALTKYERALDAGPRPSVLDAGGETSFDAAWIDLIREFPTRRDATVRAILEKHRSLLDAGPRSEEGLREAIHRHRDGCNGRPHHRWYRGQNKCDALAALSRTTEKTSRE